MAISTYLKNKLVDHVWGVASYSAPTGYLACYSGDPNGAGTEIETPGVDGYARQAVAAKIDAASGGVASNNTLFQFGPNTGAGTWTCNYVALMDASSGGNVLDAVAVAERTAATNASLTIPVGELTVTVQALS